MAETKKSTQSKKEETTKKTAAKKTDTKATKPAAKTTKPAAKTTKPAAKAAKPAAKATTKTTAKAQPKTTAKAGSKATAAKTTKTTKATAKKTTKDTPVEKKKPVVKTTTTKGFEIKGSGDIDNLLDILSVNPVETPKVEEPKPATKKPAPKAKKEETKAAPKKAPAKAKEAKKVVEVKRPERKAKNFTKEEKVLYKRLDEAFTYVANLTMVIEERTMDTKQIPDLTLGELHVLEVVNRELTMPMTKVANELKITVGSLTTCVNRLVKKEYLFRERDENDHRIIKISTTPKAKKVLKVHEQFHTDILYGILDGVTIRDATKVLTQVARTLENYINPKEKNYEKPIDKKKTKNL